MTGCFSYVSTKCTVVGVSYGTEENCEYETGIGGREFVLLRM